MRYEVGQVVPFILVRFQEGEDGHIWNRTGYPVFMYHPLEPNQRIIDVTIKVLTCVEHHKVPWDQDPEGEHKYDGFVFRDEDGNRWFNQYPRASYGQTSTVRDRQVTRDYDEYMADYSIGAGVNGITYASDNLICLGMQDARQLLEDTKNYVDGYNSKHLAAGADTERMRFYLACLVQVVEGATNKRVRFFLEREINEAKFYDVELIDPAKYDDADLDADETVVDGLTFGEAMERAVAEDTAKGVL